MGRAGMHQAHREKHMQRQQHQIDLGQPLHPRPTQQVGDQEQAAVPSQREEEQIAQQIEPFPVSSNRLLQQFWTMVNEQA